MTTSRRTVGTFGRLLAAALGITVLGAPPSARAATLTWWATGSSGLVGGTGTWNTTNANWTSNGSSFSAWNNATNDTAVFGGAASGTVTLATSNTAGGLTFNTSGYTIAGNNLMVIKTTASSGTADIAVNVGNVTISSTLFVLNTVSKMRKLGSGTLTLTATNTLNNTLDVEAGSIRIGADQAFGAITGSGTSFGKVTVKSGASVDFNGIGGATYGYTISGSGVDGTGALVNTGAAIVNTAKQATNMRLAADAAIGGSGNWALLAQGYGVTALDLNGFTLTKTGTNAVFLCNTAILNTGTISIVQGRIAQTQTGATGTGVVFALADTSGVTLDLASLPMTIGGLSGGGSSGGNVTLGTGTLTVGASGQSTTFGGAISNSSGAGSFTKVGTGTLTLTGNSTLTGRLIAGEGILSVATIGGTAAAGPLGQGTVGVGNGSTVGTLRYTGTGETSNRVLLLSGSTGGGVIEANGTGPLVLTGAVTAAAGNKTLTLAGSNTGNNSTGPINDAPSSGGVTSLVKTGVGRWVLSGSGNYTGPTTIEQGELILAANAIASGSGALGANTVAAITIGSASGSGMSALLLHAGVTVNSRAFMIPGGAQATVIGALGSGTATFGSLGSASITFGRDFTVRAATEATLLMNNAWTQSSGTSVNVTVGGIGNEGTVVLGQPLAATGTVHIDRGVFSLATSATAAGSLTAASAIVVGPAGSIGATLNVRDLDAAYSFGAGQTLSGIGTLQLDANTPVSIAGLFSPGNSPGLFTFDGSGTTTLSGATLMEISGTARGVTGGYDAADLTNGSSLVLGGALELWFGSAFNDGETFKLFTLTGTGLSGNFTSVSMSGSTAAYAGLTWNQSGSVWNSTSTESGQSLRFNPADGTLVVVPEPATLALAAVGIGLGGWVAYRRRQ